MLQYNNSGGVMEAVTISKNGRSSKSQMSRGNFFGKAFLSFFVAAIAVSLVTGLSGCEKKTEDFKSDFPYYQWMLLSITSLEEEFAFDYSEKNIIYEIKANNVLTVSGDIEGIDYRGFEIGNHFYDVLSQIDSHKVGPNYGFYGCDIVKINNIPYVFSIVNDQNLHARMEIRSSEKGRYVFSFLKVG